MDGQDFGEKSNFWLGRKRSLVWVSEWSRILPVFHTGVEEFCYMIACYNTKIYRQAVKEISIEVLNL